ncbi:MAG: SDR family oxidoreductase, partial [Rhodobacteraceae bacterium]|nr:SDR family oxidoreductase [Paracoccaceae bacterium]
YLLDGQPPQDHSLHVPYFMKSFDILAQVTDRCFVRIDKGDLHIRGGDLYARLRVYNSTGDGLLDIQEMMFKRVSDRFLTEQPAYLPRVTAKQPISDTAYYSAPVWIEQPISPAGGDRARRPAIVFLSANSVGTQLSHAITQRYPQSFFITAGQTFARNGEGHFVIDAAREQDYVKALGEIFADVNQQYEGCDIYYGWSYRAGASAPNIFDRKDASPNIFDRKDASDVYYGWSYRAGALSLVDEQDIEALQTSGLRSFFLFTKALCRSPLKRGAAIVAASRDTHIVTMQDHGAGYGDSGLFGFAQAVMREHPGITITLVDCVEDELPISTLIAEGLAAEPAERVAYRDHRRYVYAVEPVTVTARQDAPLLKDHGVYLLLGGLGGLGFKIAELITQQVPARLALIGSSTINAAKQQQIDRLKASGSEVLYLQADITNMAQMKEVVRIITRQYKEINGVIQASGILEDKLVVSKEWNSFRRVLSPKIRGTWIVNRLTQTEPLDFFVCFSSVVAITGNIGQSDYAAANGFLDAFMQYRARNDYPGKSLSINWTLWADGGMGQDPAVIEAFSKKTGVISGRAGLQAFTQLLNGNLCQAAVAGRSQAFESLAAGQMPQPGGIQVEFVRPLTPAEQPQVALDQIQADLLRMLAEIIEASSSELDAETDLREYG